MLDTAFAKKMPDGWPSGRMKAWSYIGRFIWGFAMVEYQVNQLFEKLLNADSAAITLLTYTLDLRKKLELIELILQNLDIDENKTLKRVHAFHDLRNVVAHWPFFEYDESGLGCDYMNKQGETDFLKPGIRARDNLITYAEFDSYDAEASALYEKLEDLLDTSITDFGDDLQVAIEKAISSSNNVVRFASKLQKDNEH